MFAVAEAHRAGLFNREHWSRNLLAGAVVGVVALPLAMAFAIASGAKPEQGLYTAIVAGVCVSLCGGTRLQIAGPTGAFIVLLSAITAKHGMGGLQVATLMAGGILVLLGLTHMGSIIRFIPSPVIVGFTAGVAVIIAVGQVPSFLGLPPLKGEHFHEKLISLGQSLPRWEPATAGVGLLSLLLLVLWPKLPRVNKVPSPLVALLVCTALVANTDLPQVATIGSAFHGIPGGLPPFRFPSFTFHQLVSLVGPAFTIAMLGAIESLLSAVVADGMAGTKHDPNQELVGQGIANLLTPLFGGFAATGAIARTATNIRHGGNSPLAGLVHAALLLFVLLALAPLARNIPLCTLAAILLVVAFNMSEMKHIAHMVKVSPKTDLAILFTTLGLTIFADLVVAVNIGVIMSTFNFLRRMSSAVEVHPVSEQELAAPAPTLAPPPGVLIYAIEGPFFFGAVENFERALAQTHTDPRLLVIRLGHVPFMDMTGIQTLEEAIAKLNKRGVRVVFCEARETVRGQLSRTDVPHLLGEHYCFDTLAQAVAVAE